MLRQFQYWRNEDVPIEKRANYVLLHFATDRVGPLFLAHLAQSAVAQRLSSFHNLDWTLSSETLVN